MKTDIWMPIYIGDYLKDTRHLNTEEHGAYFLILIELWNKNGKIKKTILPRITLKTDKEFFDNIWPQIEEFFLVEESGFVTQKRLSLELKSSIKRRKVAKDNGKKGGRPVTQKKPIGLPKDNPQETSSSSPSPSSTSLPKPSSKPKKNVWVLPEKIKKEVWEEYEAHRKTTKTKLTDAARTKNANVLLDNLSDQQEIVDTAIKSGWTGLFPLKNNQGKGGLNW